jgi:hypothetical protein
MTEKATTRVAPDILVRGGTTSSTEDRERAIRKADAERRRKVIDEQYAVTRTHPGEAKMSSMRLGAPDGQYAIVLWVKEGRNLEPREFMLCELSAQPKGDEPGDVELVLLVACMRCITRRHRPVAECNLTIRQTNRPFTLEQKPPKWLVDRWKGSLWINPDNRSETCQVVGTIHMHERAHCAECNWTFVIDDSVLITIN